MLQAAFVIHRHRDSSRHHWSDDAGFPISCHESPAWGASRLRNSTVLPEA